MLKDGLKDRNRRANYSAEAGSAETSEKRIEAFIGSAASASSNRAGASSNARSNPCVLSLVGQCTYLPDV
ncbi:MAG: hypothetical protein JWN63_980 [Candidatus Acidoferrum typicum]|nr:hypothetical protein [Candidatus Acidoferrum typicum]